MFAAILRRMRGGFAVTAGAILFALIMTFSLCGLSAASKNEIAKYEEAYRTIRVPMTVTSLTGMRRDGLELPKWVVNAFYEWPMDALIKDVQIKMHTDPELSEGYIDGSPDIPRVVVGVSTPELDRDLERYPDAITYFDGFDESIWSEENFYIIIPEDVLKDDGSAPRISMTFRYDDPFDSWPECVADWEFTVVGTHSLDRDDVFASYKTVERIYKSAGMPFCADSVRATIANNDHIEAVRKGMSKWFVEPSITAERVPWKYSYYFYYPFALDVDDSQLIRAGEVMRTNIKINEISTVAVFILSAAAGFLMGFLMINRRRREIMLMRTVGVPDARIFLEFFAEQLVLCTIGAAIGGVAFSWQPIERIAVFIGLYSAGLAISLIVFLRKNLLTSIKEE